MKSSQITVLLLAFTLVLNACKQKSSETSKTIKPSEEKNPYLGQTPPGAIPEPFAPGLVTTTGWEYSGVFNPDMTEFYFLRELDTTKGQEFVVYKQEGTQWKEEVISARRGQPFVSPDGQTIHLGRRYMERQDPTGWSEVKLLDNPFKDLLIMRLTSSSKGTYFFDEFKEDLTGDLRYSRLIDGAYEAPQLLSANINNGQSFHPFIAPDESYLIFDSTREEGYGDSDIYISYKQPDGSWGDPINLGPEINTEAWKASATMTPDGKYLFFNRMVGPEDQGNVDIFWVDAQKIKDLRPNQ